MVYGLSAASALSVAFMVTPGNDAVRFVRVSAVAAVVLLVVAVLGAAGARTARPVLYLVAGLLALAVAVLQLVQAGTDMNWVGGNAATATLLAGLGIGFVALSYAASGPPPTDGADELTAPA